MNDGWFGALKETIQQQQNQLVWVSEGKVGHMHINPDTGWIEVLSPFSLFFLFVCFCLGGRSGWGWPRHPWRPPVLPVRSGQWVFHVQHWQPPHLRLWRHGHGRWSVHRPGARRNTEWWRGPTRRACHHPLLRARSRRPARHPGAAWLRWLPAHGAAGPPEPHRPSRIQGTSTAAGSVSQSRPSSLLSGGRGVR